MSYLSDMRRARLAFGCLLVFLSACAPRPTPAVTPDAVPSPTVDVELHAPEIRFALIGKVKSANVWALFDSNGYTYNDYAIRSEYWPRLYRVSLPGGEFEAQAAGGMPSAIVPEGDLFTASVPLRSDLVWTDGSPFTAEDAAFTINTALSFKLGFDWQAYYNPELLERAEAIDAHMLKFYFRRAPDVAAWQYGALLGPLVQEKYWAPKIVEADALLPLGDTSAQIAQLKIRASDLQNRVDALLAESVAATGDGARQIEAELVHARGDLDQAINNVSKAEASQDAALMAGREALFALDEVNEPTLGSWMPAGRQNGIWVNAANPAHPFGKPHFDRATYTAYPDQAAAINAFAQGNVDSILDPNGITPDPTDAKIQAGSLIESPTSSAHFLVINTASRALADAALRRAVYCSIDRASLALALGAAPLLSFIPPANSAWANPTPPAPCGEGYDPINGFDRSKAVAILKSAGYTWDIEPAGETPGAGLRGPDGNALPVVSLLTPPAESDLQGSVAGQFIEQAAVYLGIPVNDKPSDPGDIRFAVFNSREYELAVVGWRLSTYPGYLCDWFGEGNPFGYQDEKVLAACQALKTTDDLQSAQKDVVQIEALLAERLPFVPLYTGVRQDAYRNIRYPFEQIQDGPSALYGGATIALPVPP